MQQPLISNKPKLHLMLCELHNPVIHGKTKTSCPTIERHYLVFGRYNPFSKISYEYTKEDQEDEQGDNEEEEEEEEDDFYTIHDDVAFLRQIYSNPSNYTHTYNPTPVHPTIRNYVSIVTKPGYIKPEIGQYIILPTQEAVAILKTHWIRLIQRKWKKVFQERKHIMRQLCNQSSLQRREMRKHGPTELPGLRGMLSDLLT